MPNNILKVTFKSAESATHVERAKQPHDKMWATICYLAGGWDQWQKLKVN
jgi:hypothetical protein